ncbi:hypothetical protein AVEN_29496-1 [Araneus ventricosus]|uniref:Uncharacterized protein n=1 Tax=Araneus ventricosus TaxID=182803 RepID=A0A4Y2SKI6_ARAVE|nr:hypothetical protein AVEN_29496-1 [Araneus ventricosus]
MRIESNGVSAKSIFSSQSLTGRMVTAPASRALGREFYPGLCSYSVFAIICNASLLQVRPMATSRLALTCCKLVSHLHTCRDKFAESLQICSASLLQTKIAIWEILHTLQSLAIHKNRKNGFHLAVAGMGLFDHSPWIQATPTSGKHLVERGLIQNSMNEDDIFDSFLHNSESIRQSTGKLVKVSKWKNSKKAIFSSVPSRSQHSGTEKQKGRIVILARKKLLLYQL